MRFLKVTITTRDGEVLDQKDVEVSHDVREIALVPITPGSYARSSIGELEIGALGTSEL